MLKDQKPLIEANVALEPPWTMGDFVEYLNCIVFFWPGYHDGPIASGRRLHGTYEREHPLVLRIPTADLFESQSHPLFAIFNTGATRMQKGMKISRGLNEFRDAATCLRKASEVKEVGFASSVALPDGTCRRTPSGWEPF